MTSRKSASITAACAIVMAFLLLTLAKSSLSAQEQPSQEELQKELKRYNEMVADNPQNYLYRNSLGETLFLMGKFEEALQHFTKLVELTPHEKDEVMAYNKALCLYKLGRYDEARREFLQAAAAQKKGDSGESLTLGDVYGEYFTAVCLYRTGKFKEAEQLLTELTAEWAKTFDNYLRETTFASQTFEKTEEGLVWNGVLVFKDQAHFEDFVKTKVKIGRQSLNYFGALVIRALCRNKLNDRSGAMQDLNDALAVNPDSGLALFLRGKWLMLDKKENEAKNDLAAAAAKGFTGVKGGLPEELEIIKPLSYTPTLYFK